ncbi:dihydrolipoyl dehydrogenase [Methylobacterium organophilum]|uniref:Dihydrolipoyl dehydrogenase n=1 Tax=Methylobacterium organophilum TaxID=410 RepID=A0ABQ4T5L4_METOR|nr:dihydrolipoyl dehydrogenase [Methylobacterium organophilum]GJE25922.1 Dihydrolipoyl dehydrogenase [Methylobacterium organophilum]
MREAVFDVAVIGAGTAGIAAHRAALAAGVRSILIERGPGGTTCARVGCMPSKLLITAADTARQVRDAGRFGITAGQVGIDGGAVLRRVRSERDRFVGGVFDALDALPDESRMAGHAVFEASDLIRVDDHTRIRFKAAVIATGSSPSLPPPLRGLEDRVLTTDTLFEIPDLPESLAVLGGGPVGLELAQAMARLGVRTSLIEAGDAVGGLSAPDLAEAARDIFAGELDLHLGTRLDSAGAADDGLVLHWTKGDRKESGHFARCLVAAGRPPNLSGLGLESTGLHLDDKGSPDFDPRSLLCRGVPILIAGDANQDRPVLHEASRQGRIAGRNAARLAQDGPEAIERPGRWVDLAMVFSDPQIALVGGGYRAASEDAVVGSADFGDQGRARVAGRNRGGLRLYADRTGRLTGAEMIGPGMEHLAHLVAYAVQDGLTAAQLRDRPFYHPTLEEGLETALSDIESKLG